MNTEYMSMFHKAATPAEIAEIRKNCEHEVIAESSQECALAGAAAAMAGVQGSGTVIHGAAGCGWSARWARSDNAIVNYAPLIADNILRHNVIFGGSDKLRDSLKFVGEYWKPKLIFLILGCAGSLINDPVAEIAAEVERETNIPCLVVDTPGFRGTVAFGMDETFGVLLNRFAKEGIDKERNSVNLIAPYLMGSGNWVYDVPEIKSLLETLGLKVNCILSYDTGLEEIERFGAAEADIYLTYEEMPRVREIEDKFALERLGLDLPLPLGAANTEDWYYAIANRFGKGEEAKKIIRDQVNKHVAFMKYSWNCTWVSTWMSNKRVVVHGPATFAAAFANFLYFDMTAYPAIIALYGETKESIERAKSSLSEMQKYFDPIILENPLEIEVRELAKVSRIELAFGKSQDKVLFEGDCGIAHTTVMGMQSVLGTFNFVPYPYMGIKGIPYLYQVMGRTVEHAFHETNRWKGLAYKRRGERVEAVNPL